MFSQEGKYVVLYIDIGRIFCLFAGESFNLGVLGTVFMFNNASGIFYKFYIPLAFESSGWDWGSLKPW